MSIPICPYCSNQAKLIPSSEFYSSGINYGFLYICTPCDARVGTHKNTAHLPEPKPLGSMANAELRSARNQTHEAFDQLWRCKLMPRKEAYRWLADAMAITYGKCHIAMFNLAQCQQAQILSNTKASELQSK